jgi:hypothetical protein
VTAPSAAEPIVNAEGSLKVGPLWAPAPAPAPAPAGEGVAGTAGVELTGAEAAGAGAAGVAIGALGAGVAGAWAEAEAEEAAGLGPCRQRRIRLGRREAKLGIAGNHHTLEGKHTRKSFSWMLYDSTVLSSWRILPAGL